jgi:hypothetical protein
MMKNVILLLFFTIIISACKKSDKIETINSCDCDNPTNQITDAYSMILGDWVWISTAYSYRGSETYFETPQNTNNQINYIFTIDSLTILKNGVNVYKAKYSIGYFGENSNSPTDNLVVKYSYSDTSNGVSMLFLDKKCMRLVNSYDDAGGNVTLKKL